MEDVRSKTYSPERITATIPVARFLQDYVDVPRFLEYCKACPSYEKLWSCPPYSLDVVKIWNKYETLELVGVKVKPSAELRVGTYRNNELEALYEIIISEEKGRVTEELLARERGTPGSLLLSAGSCHICSEGCTRAGNQPCRHPDLMRYSIESLGGNVQKAAHDLLDTDIMWPQNGKMPAYFVLVAGLLTPQTRRET